MHDGIPGWTPDLERSFKEVVFRFLEEIQCTKAALYLQADDGVYVLVTQYGFGRRDQLAAEHRPHDPLVAKARELRNRPWAANHPNDFPGVARYLEAAGTARMLLVPLYSDSRVAGFVDARDKGRKALFDGADLERAAAIASTLLNLLGGAGMCSGPAAEPGASSPAAQPESGPLAIPVAEPTSSSERRAGSSSPIDRDGLAALLETAREELGGAEVVGAAVSIVQLDDAATVVMARDLGGGIDTEAVLRHQRETLARAGIPAPAGERWRLELRRVGGAPGEHALLIASDLLQRGAQWSLVASVVGALGTPAAALALERLRRIAAASAAAVRSRAQRFALAGRLLEPSGRRYAALVAHSRQVSRLAWTMSRLLSLSPAAVEDAALAGLLHDLGMRELSYDRLYRMRSPNAEDRRTYQQHVLVGESLVDGAGLAAVSAAVRHHHERWDGGGYPDHLAGAAIPLLARIVHLAEVYDVLTSADSYRPAVTPDRALAIIRSAACQQLAPELVPGLQQAVA